MDELTQTYGSLMTSNKKRVQPMTKPVIYCAGRMDASQGDDWRDHIHGFCYGEYDSGNVDCGSFWYGGPFAIDTTGGHSAGHASNGDGETLREVWSADKAQIENADLFVAYIADVEAYGTLVEIGYAAALGKPVVIGFDDGMILKDLTELWLCRMLATRVYWGKPAEVWECVSRDWIR